MEDQFEQLGILIDEIDNLSHAINLPLASDLHIEALRKSLPEKVKRLKTLYIEITGENPWD